MMKRFLAASALSAMLGLALSPPALALGDGGGGGPTVTQCKKGMVWDKKKGKCVKPKAGLIDDESLYEAGRDLAIAERYPEAIEVLNMAANRKDPRILNYLGYSNRKMGNTTAGLDYYRQALAIDPNYTLVREYLGEAHLQLGDLASAKEQLGEIEKRCGTTCEEYEDLSKEIAEFEKG